MTIKITVILRPVISETGSIGYRRPLARATKTARGHQRRCLQCVLFNEHNNIRIAILRCVKLPMKRTYILALAVTGPGNGIIANFTISAIRTARTVAIFRFFSRIRTINYCVSDLYSAL